MGQSMTICSSPKLALEQTGALVQQTGCTSAPVAWPPKGGHTLGLTVLEQRCGGTRFDWSGARFEASAIQPAPHSKETRA